MINRKKQTWMRQKAVSYTHLDVYKRQVLEPRGLDYKIMFAGPTGTNAVESLLKLARKVKKLSLIHI